MKLKNGINSILVAIVERKSKEKRHRPLTNHAIINGLKDGYLYIACIVSTNKNFLSKAITFFSGPFGHVVALCDTSQYPWTAGETERKINKLNDYYDSLNGDPAFLVLASADNDGMNYFDVSVYQNREMIIFKVDVQKETAHGIIRDLLSPEIMKAKYDYTGLAGQILRAWGWLYSMLDDKRAYYCSELVDDVFRKHGYPAAHIKDPSPTQVYAWLKNRAQIVYSNLKKEY